MMMMVMMMMKPRSLICFLVLALSSLSRGHNTTEEHHGETTTGTGQHLGTPKMEEGTPKMEEAPNESSITLVSPVTPSYQTPPSGNTTDKEEAQTTLSDETTVLIETTVPVLTTVSSMTPGGSIVPKTGEESGPPSWAYVLLVLILLVIIALCTLLFFLRRASRTYSFDLQRPPVNHHSQPTGTFEAVYLDERPDLKDHVSDDLSPPPVANGTSQQLGENNSEETADSQQQPDSNGVDTPTTITTNITSASADGPADKTSDPPSNADLLFDAVGEQQNENNNNPSVCSSDPFVEINLDEPAWCDQLLTSPVAASSSVLPFSPFSFSSSSSSS